MLIQAPGGIGKCVDGLYTQQCVLLIPQAHVVVGLLAEHSSLVSGASPFEQSATVSVWRTSFSGSQRGASASCGKTQTYPHPHIKTGSGPCR